MNLHWASLSEFWAMGGHGFFVWMSFGAAFAAIAVEALALRHRRARALERIEAERTLEATD